MREDDRKLVEELRRIGGKPCLAIAAFLEDAEARPDVVLAKAREMEANLPEPVADLETLLENARAIATDLIEDAAQKEARREALKTAGSIDELIEASERMLYEGDFSGARQGFADAVAKTEEAFGEGAKQLVVPLMGLARASGQEATSPGARVEEELRIQARALAIAEATLPGADLILAEVLHAHGVTTWASGNTARAVELLGRALEVATSAGADVSAFLPPLVGALLDAGRPLDALPHARALLALEASGGKTDLTTLFVIGQALRDAGAHEEARVVLQRFLDEYGEEGNPAIRDEVRGWLAKLATN